MIRNPIRGIRTTLGKLHPVTAGLGHGVATVGSVVEGITHPITGLLTARVANRNKKSNQAIYGGGFNTVTQTVPAVDKAELVVGGSIAGGLFGQSSLGKTVGAVVGDFVGGPDSTGASTPGFETMEGAAVAAPSSGMGGSMTLVLLLGGAGLLLVLVLLPRRR